MKNLLNNLLNWVLKKGSSETKKEQAWEEKEQAGSKKDQVKRTKLVQKRTKLREKEQAEQKGNKLGEKGTSLEMNPCVMGSEVREVRGSEAVSANYALITQLSRNNHPISLRAIRYAAVIFMVLMVGIGNVWGASPFSIPDPSANTNFQDGITVFGIATTGKINNETSKKFFDAKNASLNIFSECANISSISFDACSNSSGSSADSKNMTIKVSTSGTNNLAIPSASSFTALKDGSTLSSLTDIGLNKDAQSHNNITISFNTPVKAIEICKGSGSNGSRIHNLSITYTSDTRPTEYFKATLTAYNVATINTNPGGASITLGTKDGNVTISSNKYYQMDGTTTIDLGTGHTFQVGDQIIAEVTKKGIIINGCTCAITITNAIPSIVGYVVAASDGVATKQSCSITRISSDSYIRSIRVLRSAAPEPECGETAQAALTLSSNSGTICGTGSTTFTVSGGSGSGALSVSSSDDTKATASIDGSTVTVTGVAAGSATITVTKACDATYAEKTATYSATVAAIPTANAGVDKTTEPGNGVALAATAAASGCTGAWTIESGPNTSTAQLSSTSSATATFTPTVAGTYTLRWTVTNTSSSCSAYDEMTVTAAVCSISDCGNATLTYPIYTAGDLTTSNLFSSASSTNATAVSVGASPTFEGVTISAAKKGSAANEGACYAKGTALTGKMQYSTSSKSSSYYIDFPFTVNTGYTFTPCDVQVVIQPVSSNQAFTVEITDGTNVYGTSTATLNAGVMEPIIGLTSTAEMSAGNYAVRLYPHGGSSKEFRMGANVILKGTTAAAAPSCTAPDHVDISGDWDKFGGETISLTATAYSSAGTGSPIADGNITGWQWEKLVGSTWTALSNGTAAGVTTSGATTKNLQISNCGQGNSGKYRCVVSTGATCSTASATATDGSEGYVVKVYALECYTGGTTVYNFTRDGNNQRGSLSIALTASTGYAFKIHADKYYGNNGTINFDENNWTFTVEGNNVTVNSGLGGTFTFTIDYSSNGDVPVLAVTYPRKRIYLVPNSDWLSNSAKFAYYYFHKTGDDTDAEGWTDFLTEDDCGMYADIPQWNGVKMIAVRFNSTKTSTGNWSDKWNQTSDLTVTSNDLITITDWDNSQTYNSTYSTPTYTIGYAKGSVPTGGGSISGSKSNETKTCGVDFTLPSSAVFTTTGYTQTGWTTSDGGAQEYTLGGTYTTNEDKTFYPVWTVNNYDLTWNLGGGTTTSAGTGIASGVSSNTTTSQAFGTALTAPTVTKTGYNFSAWSPAVASTMPAANTTYTATWTVKTTTITIDANTANHGSTAPSPITATYGSALPSFTAATGASGWNLTGYFTAPTSGTKVINADGTLVASTDYADGSGNWKYETATLTLYPQYEEEGCTPTTASITFNNNVAGKYNTAWVAGDITTSGGATYTLTNTSCDTGHPMTKPAIKGAKNKTLIQINIPAGATSGTISVSAATYEGGAATLAITNSGGSVLASQSLSGTTTNPDAGSWSAPTLKTASYNITSGGTYYIKETSNSNNIYIYAFSATAEVPCDETAPTFVSSVPANGATGVATSGTIVLTFSEALGSVDASKFTLTGATKGAVSIDGSDATKVNIAYSGAANEATVTLATAAAAVSDVAGNSSAALSSISFTTSAAEPDPLVHWTMKINDTSWGTTATATTDETNITSINTSRSGTATGSSSSATVKVTMASEEVTDNSAPSNSANFTFTINAAKKVEPERVTCEVFNVSSGNRTYKAQISDSNGHVYNSTNTVAVDAEATLTPATFTFASDLVLTGNVTVKVYAWKTAGSPTEFRMGQHVKLFGEVQNAADYTVTHTLSNVTKSAGATSVKEGNNYTATYAGAGGYALPSTITVTIGGDTKTVDTDYTWNQGTGVVTIPGNKVTGNIVITVTGVAPAPTYSVTHSLTNVTATSGATGAGAATEGVAYNAVFTANTGYVLPSTITVTIGGETATVGTGYTWNASTGAFQVPAEQVTGAIVITIAGETAPATKDIYYGHVKITDGALVREIPSGATQFFTNIGGTVANNTEISLSSTPSTGGIYYNSNNLTDAELSKSSNWGTSSGSNRYVRGLKFANGTTYTLALGTKVASVITFYGWCGSSSKTMTVGDEEFTSSATKETFAKHEFIKTGGFTGNVTITEDGDFYGILVITIQTATPCTTPVIPALSNQSLCEGADIAAWNATVTNASAISTAGETVTYSWKKKGNATELANTASFDLGASAAESQAGTYVVTVTVSKTGYASSTATKEVTLSVTDGIEVTAITADKATVYPTNSVTLTATASADATWQWYTCTNAEGDEAAIISGAESASYTIASAGAAGTYYYKAVATGSCGTGSMVYTLTVSAAAGGDCFHFVSVIPESNINISSGASIVTPTHATTLEGGTMKVGSQQVVITAGYGLKMEGTKTVSITLDAALAAGNVVIVKGTSGTKGYGITINGVNFYDADNKTFDVSYTVLADDGLEGQTALNVSKYSGSSYLQEIKITGCGASCTDPEVTASVNNSTACVGSSVTFTATGAHAEATYQWQKYSGGAWTNIASATVATYNIASVVAGDAGKYRVIASHDCKRTSNEVTLNVPVAPVFADFTATRSVMATQALSITDVEASDATSYAWYKSADATYDAGTDTRVGTAQELLLAAGGEAAGDTYYLFCVASNSCGSTTSSAITVNVTAFIEEDCATRGTEGAAEFGFQNSGCSQGTYNGTAVWSTGTSNSKILIYSAPDGKYFKTMKVTIASSSASQASYNWSTDGGTTYTSNGVAITGVTTTLTEKTINLSAHGNVNEVKIGRNFGNGESSGTLYVSKICFEYTSACTATTVTPSTSSENYEMDGSSFTEPTFTVKHGETAFDPQPTLSYSSSNEDIASVDDDGTVTFNGEAGTVTITASYAGGTISETEYCASSGSYTINVSCPGGAPKVVASGSVDMSGCNSSVTLLAKTQADGDFADGTYQWFRNGEEIDGATSSSYTATQAGTYTVERTNTSGCTTPSTNSAIVTSETTEPEVERLVPFQYYHVNKVYAESSIMRFRHLFAVKNSGTLDGKHFKMYVSCNGGAATDVTSSNALVVVPNGDGHVDTVMVDLNKLSGKYNENDELVFTCKAIDCRSNISEVYKNTITMNVIGATPTLALICSGSNKAGGTRKTSELTVGGDFLTGYNVADLCQQTGNTSFDANTEWGLYTRLKENYIVTPVNGYAVFNKLNYEPFDILLLTDYPKASKSDAAATVLDDMADLCDYRPMLSFKAHMVAKTPSKWAAKGFTTSPVVPKNTRTRLNIVCYAHPMFADMKTTATHIQKDNDDPSQIVYTMLTGAGYESSKGLQGFELEAAENFVTIGLVHYNATPADGSPSAGLVTWTPGSEDRMLVTAVERQENLEARMIMFAVNCGAQSKFTETGRNVVLKCLEYLLDDDPLHVADCSFTFDNGAGNSMDDAAQAEACPSCTGTKGDGKWSTAANWGPDYVVRPGKDTEVKIAAPVTVDPAVGEGAATNFTPIVRSVRILEGGKVEIPAGSYLEVVSTIRRQDGNDIYPTEVEDLHIGSSETGNGTLILNNSTEDTKAQVDMFSKGFIDDSGEKNFQYIGTPFVEVNALYNYYGSWIYWWNGSNWKAVRNGGPMTAWTGYCITQEAPTYHQMSGTLTATTTVDIPVGAGQDMVVGNSWTAPLYIKAFTDDDFENLLGNVYFFNTGIEKDHTLDGNMADGDRYAGSTYVTVPIHAASYTGDSLISSLQGFFVTSNGSAGTLHLDYDRHVRPTKNRNILSGPMHAPKRYADSNEPEVVKIKVSGENYDDRLVLLARADFSAGFDNGWDGDKWDGNASALYIYTTDSEGTENSVSAVPELEGTIIGFRAGEDDAYTLNFEYLNSDEPLYLYDVENNTYTQIMTGMTYRFFTTDNEKHERFIITRSNGQEVATGVESSSGSLDRSKAKKLLIEDKMFIIVNGMLYDATGKVVK